MLDKIIEIICDYQGVDKQTVNAKTFLVADLELNSYDVVALVTRFEDEFDIEIPDRAIRKLQTVNDIYVMLEDL